MNNFSSNTFDLKNQFLPLPKNKDGFFHLYAHMSTFIRSILQNAPVAFQILQEMNFICHLLNRINLERKCNYYSNSDCWNNEYNEREYEKYCKKWANSLPWTNAMFSDYTDASSKLKAYHFAYDSQEMINICNSNMNDFLAYAEQLYIELLELFKEQYNFNSDSPDELHIMVIEYLNYAFNDLKNNWYDQEVHFIAPLYAIDEYNTETYGSYSEQENILFFSFIPACELVSVYDTVQQKIVEGCYDACGEFEVIEFVDSFHDDWFADEDEFELPFPDVTFTTSYEDTLCEELEELGELYLQELELADLDEWLDS